MRIIFIIIFVILVLVGVLKIKWLLMNASSVIAIIGILAVLFSLWKVFLPSLKLKIVSYYSTMDRDKKGLFILKLQSTSNVDLTLEDVQVKVTLQNGKTFDMIPFSVRWKGVFFKMLDIGGKERDYKLLKPLDPDLRTCGIKQGNNEYYISLRSEEPFEDRPIKSWLFELKWQQHMLPIPNIPWFNKKTIIAIHPKGKDLYFDDSLFQKISPEERNKLISEL